MHFQCIKVWPFPCFLDKRKEAAHENHIEDAKRLHHDADSADDFSRLGADISKTRCPRAIKTRRPGQHP
jgi:hypothetical protein